MLRDPKPQIENAKLQFEALNLTDCDGRQLQGGGQASPEAAFHRPQQPQKRARSRESIMMIAVTVVEVSCRVLDALTQTRVLDIRCSKMALYRWHGCFAPTCVAMTWLLGMPADARRGLGPDGEQHATRGDPAREPRPGRMSNSSRLGDTDILTQMPVLCGSLTPS
eukprot:2830031-Rhodomonas_salina.1